MLRCCAGRTFESGSQSLPLGHLVGDVCGLVGDQGRTGSSANVGLLVSRGRSEDGFLAVTKCELNLAGD